MRTQVAAQQHQVNLTEHYDNLLAREPTPPSESAANPTVNLSLHRLNQALQATLLSLTGHDPTEISLEDATTNAEAGDSHQLLGAGPPSEPRERRASDTSPLQSPTELTESPQPNTAASHSAQVEPELEAQLSDSEPPLSHDNAIVPATVTATADATADPAATTTTIIATTTTNPTGSRDPSPTTRPETETADAHPEDSDWSEVREHEITRLGSENARLRALLGIDSDGLAAAGIPDIDPEPPLTTSAFLGAPHPPAAGSSAWANANAETANPFTFGFREDPSVLGLAATPSRLHTLTPPNAPNAMMTTGTADSATPNTSGGATTGRSAGVFVSASWGAPPASNGAGAGVGVGPGPLGPPQLQQQMSSPPPLGIASLARTMELQGPGIGGPGSGSGGVGRGRGVLFGGRGRSVGW